MTKISPRLLFLSGLLVLPAFLFQDSLLVKAAQTAVFIILCLFFHRKMMILPPLIAFISVTVMNLLAPYGEVLITLGRFPLTDGALNTGLQKALTLIGLIYLSKLTITKQTPLPGNLGTLIAKTFFYFEGMTEEWKNIKEKKLLVKLDTLLLKLEAIPKEPSENERLSGSSRLLSLIFALFFTGANWFLLWQMMNR